MSLLAASALVLSATLTAPPEDGILRQIERARTQLVDRLAPSVVYISRERSTGTGFFVTGDGLILTNAHVVGRKETVDVVTHGGKRLSGRVVERVEEDGADLALVRVELTGTPALPLRPTDHLRLGSWVGSIGHGMGGAWTFTAGMVSNIYPLDDRRAIFQTQIPLNPGNSGGPIFDADGYVVGIVTWGISDSNSINFAIRTDDAVRKLAGLAEHPACLVVQAPAGARIFVNGKLQGAGPRLTVLARPGTYELLVMTPAGPLQRSVTFPATRRVELLPPEP